MKLPKNEDYKIAFPTDIHAPYHDPRAISLATQIIRDYKPDILLNGGDACDFYSISSFDKDPNRMKLGFQNEIDEFQEVQRQLIRACPTSAERYLLVGNHEDRLRRYLWKNPELHTLDALKLDSILGLDSMATQVIEELRIGNTLFKHGDLIRKHSAYAAKGTLVNMGHQFNVIFGHTHRFGRHFKTRGDGSVVWGLEGGCLCDPDQADYMQGVPNWQQGLLLVNIVDEVAEPETILFHEHSKTILKAVWRGKEYRSE